MMDRRQFLVSAAAIQATVGAQAFGSPAIAAAAGPDTSGWLPPMAQPMKARYQLTLARVLHGTGPAYTRDFLLEDIHGTKGRRFTEFSGDVSGRWIGALASASAVYGQNFSQLDDVVQQVIALQHPEGYFGKSFNFDDPQDVDLALLWGNGRLLVGLMEYYSLHQDPAVLTAARRQGEFLLRLGPQYNSTAMAAAFGAAHFASSYICWTQQTEGLAALYAATRDVRYRDLCVQIGQHIQRRPSDHVHGYLCSLRGMMALYETTRDVSHLELVEAAWQDVQQSGDVLVTGGVPEAWSPKRLRTEGCAECDWLRLNLALWQATGKSIYLELAAKIIFNEFAMNQFSTGDFGHAMLDSAGIPQVVAVRAWWCCTLHGLRAFSDVQRSVFRVKDAEVFYDLPLDGTLNMPGVSVEATSRLGQDGTVSIRIREASPQQTLTLRQPSWASELKVTRNGKATADYRLTNLSGGDVITARYGMMFDNRPAGTGALEKRRLLFYGPWLLGLPSAANPGYFNELQASNVLDVGRAEDAAHRNTSPFEGPIAARSVPYVPAEYPEQPSVANLRAIAEQTACLPTRWEMTFFVDPKPTT